jgi:phosphate transport system protein
MDRPIDIQLEKLRVKLIKMCSIVEEQLNIALKSFDIENKHLADLVIHNDLSVDKYDNKIEKVCQKIFALNNPVAIDLRNIMSALKINANLERISDLSVNIARISKDLQPLPEYFERLNMADIGKLTKQMLDFAIDAYVQNDANKSLEIIGIDNKLDLMVKTAGNNLIIIMKESPENIESGILIYSLLQELERIGDHSTNIAEEVYFIVTGENIKHRKKG